MNRNRHIAPIVNQTVGALTAGIAMNAGDGPSIATTRHNSLITGRRQKRTIAGVCFLI
jgi:hypothetical protein